MQRFVFFDLGNVLIHFDHQRGVEQLAALSRKSQSLVRSTVFESDLQELYETGLVTSEEFARRVNTGLGTELPQADILQSVSDIFIPNEGILRVLDQVRQAGVPMGILSNTCEAHWEWILEQAWSLPGNWFQHHVLSYRIGSMKPAPPIYEFCEQQVACERGGIYFTDDREENVEAARQRGWSAHHFRNVSALERDIGKWLDE